MTLLPLQPTLLNNSSATLARLMPLMLAILLSACAGPSALERGYNMDSLASASHWQKLRLPAEDFVMTAYVPNKTPPVKHKLLTIYIEGDGLAWRTHSKASADPTPHKPVGLGLALHHPTGSVAYLARPCQNVARSDWGRCQQIYWTDRRYSPEVVAASDQAISALKARFAATNLVLVGYSGGGAVAALVAARRDDVVRLVTLAGNLDTRAWTALHRIPPLRGSLNPADAWAGLQGIAQLHLVGGRDPVIPGEVVMSYIKRFPADRRPAMRILPEFDHSCCWVELWPQLVRDAIP